MEKIIELYKKNKEKYKEIILYLVFGVLTTIVSVGLFWLLRVLFEFISHSFGFGDSLTIQNNVIINMSCVVFKNIIAILFAYFTNRKFVFKSKVTGFKPVLVEMINFFLARLSTLVFEVIFMAITVNIFNLNDMIMNRIAQFVIVVLNYIFSKLWIFKKKN